MPEGAQKRGGDFNSLQTRSRSESARSRLAEFRKPLVFQRKSFRTISVMTGEPRASKMVRKPVMALLNLSTAMSPLRKDQFLASESSAARRNGLLISLKGVIISSGVTVSVVVMVADADFVELEKEVEVIAWRMGGGGRRGGEEGKKTAGRECLADRCWRRM